jgi:hypothetical protein
MMADVPWQPTESRSFAGLLVIERLQHRGTGGIVEALDAALREDRTSVPWIHGTRVRIVAVWNLNPVVLQDNEVVREPDETSRDRRIGKIKGLGFGITVLRRIAKAAQGDFDAEREDL